MLFIVTHSNHRYLRQKTLVRCLPVIPAVVCCVKCYNAPGVWYADNRLGHAAHPSLDVRAVAAACKTCMNQYYYIAWPNRCCAYEHGRIDK
jgi:hypothetical protein